MMKKFKSKLFIWFVFLLNATIQVQTSYVIKATTMTRAQHQYYVDKHNEERSKVEPPATNMLRMSFDQDLADFAERYSRRCRYEHNPVKKVNNEFTEVGEDLYFSTSIRQNFTEVFRIAIELWCDEAKYYSYNTSLCTNNHVCGHYTQVVWAENYLIGCAITSCGNTTVEGQIRPRGQLIVCNYAPGGNYYGEQPYKTGRTCSECSKPNGCLCARSPQENTSTKLPKITSTSTVKPSSADQPTKSIPRTSSTSTVKPSSADQPTKSIPRTSSTSTVKPSSADQPTKSIPRTPTTATKNIKETKSKTLKEKSFSSNSTNNGTANGCKVSKAAFDLVCVFILFSTFQFCSFFEIFLL